MSNTLADLIRNAEIRPKKPLAESAREKLLAELGCHVPKAICDFYENCNGGRIASKEYRFYPLAEAVELRGAYDFHASFPFLPWFVSENNESDPCMIGLAAPLAGYIFQICHDGPCRMHAPSIESFLKSLLQLPKDGCVRIEDNDFVYPKKLTTPEAKTLQGLLDRSMEDLEDEYEPGLLVELAMSMMTKEDCVEVFGKLDHPNPHARHRIRVRLNPPARRFGRS